MNIKENSFRGNKIKYNGYEYVYSDTGQPTIGNIRACGHCSKENTVEGHDGCLGAIEGIMNACCGHGVEKEAYIQLLDGEVISGMEAISAFSNIFLLPFFDRNNLIDEAEVYRQKLSIGVL